MQDREKHNKARSRIMMFPNVSASISTVDDQGECIEVWMTGSTDKMPEEERRAIEASAEGFRCKFCFGRTVSPLSSAA